MSKNNANDPAKNLPPISHLPCYFLKAIADSYFLSRSYDNAYDFYAILADKTSKKRNTYYYFALTGLGYVLLNEKRDYDRALSFLYESLRFFESQKLSRKIESSIGLACVGIGGTLGLLKNYEQSLSYYYRAKDIFEKYDSYADLAKCYNDITYILLKLGRGKEAVEIALIALQCSKRTNIRRLIMNKGLSLPDTQTLARENLVRILDSNKDDLDEAMRLAYQSIEGQEGELQKGGDRGLSYFGLVRLYQNLNDYEKALTFAQEALDFCKTEKGIYHADTGHAYLNIAECFWGLDKKKHSDAVASANYYARTAYDILTTCKQPNNLRLAEVCILLSEICLSSRSFGEAVHYIRTGLQSAKLTVDNDHPVVLTLYEMLSEFHFKRGHYRLAFSYSEHIMSRKRDGAAESVYDLLHACYRAAFLAERYNDKQKSWQYAQEMMSILADAPNAIIKLPQEKLRLMYLRRIRSCIDQCYSIALSDTSTIAPRTLYEFTLKSNNADAEIHHIHSEYYRSKAAPHIRAAYKALVDLQTKRKSLLTEDNPSEEALIELDQKVELAEIHLIRQLENEHFSDPFSSISVEKVQEALQQNDALIEFVRYDGAEWRTSSVGSVLKRKNRYSAFLISKAKVCVIDLEDGPTVDSLVFEVCEGIKQLIVCDALLKKAYTTLLEPFEHDLVGIERLYVVPDSNLYRLPFELLIGPEGNALFESFSLAYLSSGRELLRKRDHISATPAISIIADPLFDLKDALNSDETIKHYLPDDDHLRSLGGDTAHRAEGIVPLPFTGIEADEISSLFPNHSAVIKGISATKYSIPTNNTSEYLHIATHGFAFQEEYEEDDQAYLTRSIGRGERFEKADDPLQRYGLLFAGAKTWWQGDKLPEKFGNGVLTGSDILGMDLSQYKMLVLSACETGLGEMRSGEGIKGLRHTFELAGVASLICTLWEVDDLASSVLMYKFYDELVRDETHDVPRSLNKAKNFMREISAEELYRFLQKNGFNDEALERFEDAGYFSIEHPFAFPYFWAGFIYQGVTASPHLDELNVEDTPTEITAEDITILVNEDLELIEQQYKSQRFVLPEKSIDTSTAVEIDNAQNKPLLTKFILLKLSMIVAALVLCMAAISYFFVAFDKWKLTITFAEFLEAFKANLLYMTPLLFVFALLLVLLIVWYSREIKEGYFGFLTKLNDGMLKSLFTKAPPVIFKGLKAFGAFLSKVLPWLTRALYIVLAIILVRLAIKTIQLIILVFF